jgi:hypothetical protein
MKPRELDKAPSLGELVSHLRDLVAESHIRRNREIRNRCTDFINELRPKMEEEAKKGGTFISISKDSVVIPLGIQDFCKELGFSLQTYVDSYTISWA